MSAGLSREQEELVAMGAAIAADCEPCLRFYLRAAREAGLSDEQFRGAVAMAQKVEGTPARHILEMAERLLAPGTAAGSEGGEAGCCG